MQEFPPLDGAVWGTATIALACAVMLLIPTVILFRQNKNRTQQIVAMLLGFLAMIALGTAFFQWYTSGRGGSVKVYADRIESPFLTIEKEAVRRVFYTKNSARDPRATPRLDPAADLENGEEFILIIEPKQGRRMLLSSEVFPVREIGAALEGWVEKPAR